MTSPQPDRIPDRRHFDAIVIGAGSGGLTVAVGLGRFGRRVLLVEEHLMGGDCTNTGCIPSKSLLHQSSVVGRDHHLEAEANTDTDTNTNTNTDTDADSGVEGGDAPLDPLAVVRQRRDALREHEIEVFGGAEGVTFVYGSARLRTTRAVDIFTDGGSWAASADNIILSTGSTPRRIPINGLPDDRYLTNDELFELTEIPSHLAVVGGGPTGLEMAVAFRRLGADVTVVEATDQILPGLLPEAVDVLVSVLAEDGISVRTNQRAVGYEEASGSLAIANQGDNAAKSGGGRESLDGVDYVLVSVGRTPNTTDLGLGNVGVALDENGAVIVDSRGRTTAEGVWAVGDMTNKGGTTHFASIWGRRIIQSIVYPYVPLGAEPLRPTLTFTNPEVATIGRQPPQPPDGVVRITVDGSSIDRSYTDDVDRGLLIVDVRPPTGEVLGATIVSPRAGEIITTFSLAMKAGIGFHRWYGTVIPYPTYAEVITEAVEHYLALTASDFGGHVNRWLTGVGRRSADRIQTSLRAVADRYR